MDTAITPVTSFTLAQKTSIKARAYFLAQRINLRSLEALKPVSTLPFTFASPGGGYIVLFRYGAVVFFETSDNEEKSLLDLIKPALEQPFSSPVNDDLEIRISPEMPKGMQEGAIVLNEISLEALQVIAEILGKSLVLEYYETSVAQNVEATEALILRLKRNGFGGLRTRELLQQISASLLSMQEMVGFVGVSEKPDLLWDHPEQERLYARFEDEYEIRERHMALDRKVELIFRTSQTLIDLLHAKRSLRVEWYIVALIFFEILLILFEISVRI